jgi:hypothetical protein
MLCVWRGAQMKQAQAFLLMAALKEQEISGAILPAEILQGSKHISGAAVKSLTQAGLLEVVGFAPSPNANAHGRIVRTLRIPSGKHSTVRTWLTNHGYAAPQESTQMELIA